MNNSILLKNGTVISPGFFLENCDILIEEGKISSVGKELNPDNSSVKTYELDGRFVMPGFVNPHTHLYSSLSAGLSQLRPAADFEGVLKNFWWPLDSVHNEESVYYSAVAGIIDAVKHGVTCVFDHHASMNYVEGSLETVKRAFSLAGIKGVCCFEVSDRESSAPLEKHISENIDFIRAHSSDPQMRGMLGLHANFTLSEDSLRLAAEAAGARNGAPCPIHIHCGEDRADFDFCTGAGYHGPVDRLNRFGLLSRQSILAHCIHLSDADRSILDDIRPTITVNPESNANNRVGRVDRSVLPGYVLGTDGMSFDMVSSLRSMYLLGSGLSEDFAELYEVFIERPSNLIGSVFPGAGKIEAGFDADIAVLDYAPLTPVNKDNIIGHLIFGAKGEKAYMTIAGGNILYCDGSITFTYESAVNEQIKKAAGELHKRYYSLEE